MAKKLVPACSRCAYGKPEPATEEREFSIDGSYWKSLLCAKHAAQFDRELGSWTRTADEMDSPELRTKSEYFNAERRRETERLRELKERANRRTASLKLVDERAVEIAAEQALAAEEFARRSIPGASDWKMSQHAADRAVERGFTLFEVLQTAAQPGTRVRQEWRGDNIYVHQRGVCRVVVDANTKAIITVMERDHAHDNWTSAEQAAATMKVSTG